MAKNGSTDSGKEHDTKQGSHNDLYHWVYAFGATVLLGIVDFVFLYQENHFFAFMTLAAWVSLVAVYQLHGLRFTPSEILVFVIAIFAVTIIANYIVGPTPLPETETQGWLIPSDDPIPPNNCFNTKDGLMFVAGSNITKFDTDLPSAPLLTLDGTPLISVERNGKLSFDIDLFDDAGTLAVKIIKNKFHLIPNSKAAYKEDRSDDRTQLVVHDNKDREMLRIKYANPETLIDLERQSKSVKCGNIAHF